VVIYLKLGADLHMAQLMPLPLTVSDSKIQIGFTFLVPAHPGSPGKRAVKRVLLLLMMMLMTMTIRSPVPPRPQDGTVSVIVLFTMVSSCVTDCNCNL